MKNINGVRVHFQPNIPPKKRKTSRRRYSTKARKPALRRKNDEKFIQQQSVSASAFKFM